MQGKIPLIVAVIFGAISFYGILRFLDSREVTQRQNTILIFAQDMLEGDVITETDLATTMVTGEGLGSLSGLVNPAQRSSLVGAAVVSNVLRGTPVLTSLISPDRAPDRRQRFTDLLKPGERAISLPVDSAGMVTGLLQPGDRVDILANLDVPITVTREVNVPNQGIITVDDTRFEPTTVYLLENVRILAIGANYLQPGAGEDDNYRTFSGSTVTIAVGPRAAQVMSFAMRHGRSPGGGQVTFTLLLRNPVDGEVVSDREKVTYGNVLEEAKLDQVQDELSELSGIRK